MEIKWNAVLDVPPQTDVCKEDGDTTLESYHGDGSVASVVELFVLASECEREEEKECCAVADGIIGG